MIVSDNQGYRDLGCFRSQEVRSPNLDRMAAEDVRATNFYATSPACIPSRGSILRTLSTAERACYATGAEGKWDSGRAKRFLPQQNGFDFYSVTPTRASITAHERYGVPSMFRGNELVKEGGFSEELFVLQEQMPSLRSEMFWESRHSRAARVGNFKWVETPQYRGLFDLEGDSGENHDLSEAKAGDAGVCKVPLGKLESPDDCRRAAGSLSGLLT